MLDMSGILHYFGRMETINELETAVQNENSNIAKRSYACAGVNVCINEINQIRSKKDPKAYGAWVHNRLDYLDQKLNWFSTAIRECNKRIAASK